MIPNKSLLGLGDEGMSNFWKVKDEVIEPIGYVVSSWREFTGSVPLDSREAIIRIQPQYEPALLGIGEHSHFWIISWFHQADRSLLQAVPSRINKNAPAFGVFGLRSPGRPNSIALSLVKLVKKAGLDLHVADLDAFDGTPVLDIKPYFESDVIFSPQTPYIRPDTLAMRTALFRKQALLHHGEECLGLELGIKMALYIDEKFGKISSPELSLAVTGDPCLADVLQGLTHARLANPCRFSYHRCVKKTEVCWIWRQKTLCLRVRPGIDLTIVREAIPEQLFETTEC